MGVDEGVSAKRGDLVFIYKRLNGYQYWEPFKVIAIYRDGGVKKVADAQYGSEQAIDRLLTVSGSAKYILSKDVFDVDAALKAYSELEDFTSLETENDARNFISKFRINKGQCGIVRRFLGMCR